MVEQLIYISKPTIEWDTDLLFKLLNKIHRSNSINQITGYMIYKEEYIMQYLEGSKSSVAKLYKKIKTDPRHKDLHIIFNSNSNLRVFRDFKMSFCNMSFWRNASIKGFDSKSEIKGFNPKSNQSPSNTSINHEIVKSILKKFSETQTSTIIN